MAFRLNISRPSNYNSKVGRVTTGKFTTLNTSESIVCSLNQLLIHHEVRMESSQEKRLMHNEWWLLDDVGGNLQPIYLIRIETKLRAAPFFLDWDSRRKPSPPLPWAAMVNRKTTSFNSFTFVNQSLHKSDSKFWQHQCVRPRVLVHPSPHLPPESLWSQPALWSRVRPLQNRYKSNNM